MQFPIDKQDCLVLLLVIAAVVIAVALVVVVTRKEEKEKSVNLTSLGKISLLLGQFFSLLVLNMVE